MAQLKSLAAVIARLNGIHFLPILPYTGSSSRKPITNWHVYGVLLFIGTSQQLGGPVYRIIFKFSIRF